ncbi:emp24/gp25L/p24 family/GOLD-domain-containing protein [Ampelomyces quisqualis]|uniref:Emp24/gp25L/p24 family/GOLD-domain-containing protein n=1 Tax=Ampelomyces quisqualis TaxID=50730 RepID=A0A6A5Q904_AMPQU|nr:emp24/gp25L/p24 family/GOLD-domain-containing protein [Ampelomyces quisqualis]
MDRLSRLVSCVLLVLVPLAAALKFDLHPVSEHDAAKYERCVRNFVANEQLVVVTAILDGYRGDGQRVDMHIRDAMGNDYHRPKDVVGENRYVFTSLADSAFDVCFENVYTGAPKAASSRHVELDIDIGADAKDWNTISANEKLKPVEAELRRIEETVGEIVTEMDYLRAREQKLRDTNESTNERVKWFALGTMGMLVGLGAWQVVYLRAYFRSKHLI